MEACKIMKPSELLQSKGWKPTHKDVHPQSTTWNKPSENKTGYAFIDAVLYELRDELGVVENLKAGNL
jgi:hypothetical protein